MATARRFFSSRLIDDFWVNVVGLRLYRFSCSSMSSSSGSFFATFSATTTIGASSSSLEAIVSISSIISSSNSTPASLIMLSTSSCSLSLSLADVADVENAKLPKALCKKFLRGKSLEVEVEDVSVDFSSSMHNKDTYGWPYVPRCLKNFFPLAILSNLSAYFPMPSTNRVGKIASHNQIARQVHNRATPKLESVLVR